MSLMSIDPELKSWSKRELEDMFDDVHFIDNQESNAKKSKIEEQSYYQCSDCDYKSPSKRILKNHKKNKHSVQFPCDQCNYEANSISSLNNHMEVMHGGICYICDHCNYNTKTLKRFLNHKRTVHRKKQNTKDVLKYPIPPRPVLSMKAEEIKTWFPSFFSKISFEIKTRRENQEPLPAWLKDIEEVIPLSSLKMLARNWDDIERSFFWKLKLVSAIVLDHKGFDYTDFAMEVPKKHMRYSVTDLKMMSQAKNPSTFESMFA